MTSRAALPLLLVPLACARGADHPALPGAGPGSSPVTRAARIDHERLVVRRLDVVDERGVVRLMLAAPGPGAILGGREYPRVFPFSACSSSTATGTSGAGTGR
jgi:hypothetical protein